MVQSYFASHIRDRRRLCIVERNRNYVDRFIKANYHCSRLSRDSYTIFHGRNIFVSTHTAVAYLQDCIDLHNHDFNLTFLRIDARINV